MSSASSSIIPVPDGCVFHHIGYATKNIQHEIPFFSAMGYAQEGEIFSDTQQGVAGCFMTGVGPRVELLENLPSSETLSPWINQGIKMYHFAYVADCLDEIVKWAKKNGGYMICEPVPAAAFSGKKICFLMFRNRLMLEFIER